MIPFASLPDYILGPLEGASDEQWARSPDGRWSPGQVVDHLATSLTLCGQGFAERAQKPPMARRPLTMKERVSKRIVFGTGWFPGNPKAPPATVPAPQPDRRATETKLRTAVARLTELERTLLPARATDLFLKHPRFGDLTLPEFLHFHVRHAVHHRKQIVERLGHT